MYLFFPPYGVLVDTLSSPAVDTPSYLCAVHTLALLVLSTLFVVQLLKDTLSSSIGRSVLHDYHRRHSLPVDNSDTFSCSFTVDIISYSTALQKLLLTSSTIVDLVDPLCYSEHV